MWIITLLRTVINKMSIKIMKIPDEYNTLNKENESEIVL